MLRIGFILKTWADNKAYVDSRLERDDLEYCEEALKDIVSSYEFKDFNDLFLFLNDEDGNYISDEISSKADSMVDIYYYKLREWSVDNYEFIEDAQNEFGQAGAFDFHKAIQQGQYYAYEEGIRDQLESFKSFLDESYLIARKIKEK